MHINNIALMLFDLSTLQSKCITKIYIKDFSFTWSSVVYLLEHYKSLGQSRHRYYGNWQSENEAVALILLVGMWCQPALLRDFDFVRHLEFLFSLATVYFQAVFVLSNVAYLFSVLMLTVFSHCSLSTLFIVFDAGSHPIKRRFLWHC